MAATKHDRLHISYRTSCNDVLTGELRICAPMCLHCFHGNPLNEEYPSSKQATRQVFIDAVETYISGDGETLICELNPPSTEKPETECWYNAVCAAYTTNWLALEYYVRRRFQNTKEAMTATLR
jgi:hypothetical protein